MDNHKLNTYNNDFCENESCNCDIKNALYVIADKLQLIDQRLELANKDITDKYWDNERKVYRIFCHKCDADMSKSTEYLSLSDIKYSTCNTCNAKARMNWIEKSLQSSNGDNNIFNAVKNNIDEDAMLKIIGDSICYESCKEKGFIKAVCPFPNHHKAEDDGESFVFNLNKNIFFCHGCQKGGDIITFICTIKTLSQIEAALYLIKELNLWDKVKGFINKN